MIKKLLYTTALAFSIGLSAFAQIPNSGFENWGAPFSQPQEPTGWLTANLFASPLLTFPNPNPNTASVTQATGVDKHSGTYAAKIVTVKLSYNPDPVNIPDTLGALATGSANLSLQINNGFAYTARPNQLDFFAKYTPSGVDTAFAYVELTKWNGTSRDLVADGALAFGASSAYLAKTINMVYYLSSFPDTCTIVFSSSSQVAPKLGSALYVDELSFTGWNSVNDNNPLAAFVKAYPNPANNNFTIDTELEDAKTVVIYDMLGNVVEKFELQNKIVVIDTRKFAPGMYLYTLFNEKNQSMFTDQLSIVH
jgi:hypothetical protein